MALILDTLNQAKVTTPLQNNFFQHYLHPFSRALFRRNAKLDVNLPPQQSKLKSSQSVPSRKEIVDWFLSLSDHDIIAATIIDDSLFIQQFFKNYGKAIHKLIHLPTSRIIPLETVSLSKHTQLILDWIRYCPTYKQQFYLNPEASSAKIMLQWLDEVSGKRVFQLPYRSVNRESPQQNLLWFNNQTFHSLPEWLASQFEKTIIRFYFNRDDRYQSIIDLKKYMKRKSADKKVMHMLEISLGQIAQGVIDKQRQQITIVKSFEDMMKEDYQSQLIDLNENDPNKKKKRRKRKPKKCLSNQNLPSLKDIETNQEQKNNYIVKQVNQFSLTTVSQFQEILQQTSNNDSIQMEELTKSTQVDINPQILSPIKSVSKKSQKTCCGQCSQEQSEKNQDTGYQFVSRKLSIVEQLLCETTEEKKRRKKKKLAKNMKLFEQFKEKATNRLLNKQLDAFLDSLSAQSNSNYESKVIAFERIRYFVKSIFPQAEASLFGSNAVGLALPSSDIDIMLTGLNSSSRDELCDHLAQIGVFINSMGWIVSCSTYLGAKVPLLKLQIDTSIRYFTPKIKLDYQYSYDPYLSYFLDLKDSASASIIKVDITIAMDSQQTSPSTQLMRNWLYQKPSIQRILLALKYTLSVRGYNENFKGGIGSYCLFVMVSAYFQHFNEKRQQSDCQILLDILKFYGEQFDNHLKIIHLTDSSYCYFTNQEALQHFQLTQQLIFSNPLKILDPLNKKLMSSSCYQYSMVKAEWRRIRQKILSIGQHIQQQASSSFTNPSDMAKILSNNKSFEKWVNRLQGRIQTSVGDILKGNL